MASSSPSNLKSNYAVENKYEAFYTGGLVKFNNDAKYMFCGCGNKVQILSVETGKLEHSIGQEDDPEVTCFTLSPDDQHLIVASQHLILRRWDWKTPKVEKVWKAIHTSPVSTMAFDCTSTLLATGGTDSTIKVWDIIKQYCTHNLKGHNGVITLVSFHPDITRLQLFTAGEDYSIRVWGLQNSNCLAVLQGHYSMVRDIVFSCDGNTALSCGRDNVILVWNSKDFTKNKTIPVYESIESLILVPGQEVYPTLNVSGEDLHFITAGEKGILRVWNASTAQCVHTQKTDVKSPAAIISATYVPDLEQIVTVTFDHNIVFHNFDDFTPRKQFAGYNDEVVDMKFFGPGEKYLAVATNSPQLKIYNIDSWDCQIISGHTDNILTIDVCKNCLVSSGKDNTVRVWSVNLDSHRVDCIGIGYGHTQTVTALAISRIGNKFVVSGGEDQTMKYWPLTDLPVAVSDTSATLVAKVTEKAHEKDINALTVSPNDKLLASGSQDKTAKLWSIPDLKLVGVFRGHRRGIWCVQFSPVDQAIVTSSADTTIKIWSITDFSCVKTFQGNDSSVLKVVFISRGMQLLSCGSDGLMKLWSIKTNECVKSFDEHESKVWALTVNKDGSRVATGGADSNIILWKDMTEAEKEEQRKTQDDLILKEQELSNLLQQKKYLKAIGLAITLEKPFKVLSIIREILSQPNGRESLEKTLVRLRMDQIDAVLRFAVKWNTNSRCCHEAQFVLQVVLRTYPPEELLTLGNIKETIEGFLPYTDRHFQRMNRLQQDSTFVDYTWMCMKMAEPLPQKTVESPMVTEETPMDTEETDVVDKNPSDDKEAETESESSNDEVLITGMVTYGGSDMSEDESEDDSDEGIEPGQSSLEESSAEEDNKPIKKKQKKIEAKIKSTTKVSSSKSKRLAKIETKKMSHKNKKTKNLKRKTTKRK